MQTYKPKTKRMAKSSCSTARRNGDVPAGARRCDDLAVMSGFPKDAETLLSVAPADFVTERNRLARELRDAGRKEEAAAVAALRQLPPVVLAANRAARSRPQVAKDAARAAKRVKKQLGLDAEARKVLDDALELLEDVALAFLGETKRRARQPVAASMMCFRTPWPTMMRSRPSRTVF